jgi:hypothetical protein
MPMKRTSILGSGLALLVAFCIQLAGAQTPHDSAIPGVLQHADTSIARMAVLHRGAVTDHLDLVIAAGWPSAPRLGEMPQVAWDEQQKWGLFLQQREQPDLVYTIVIAPKPPDCDARIERATVTDTVISCTGEKSARHPHRKFVYDVRAKSLVSQFSYAPYVMRRIFTSERGAVLVGTDHQRLVAVAFRPDSIPPFRILEEDEAQPWTGRVRTTEGTIGIERQRYLDIRDERPERFSFGPSGTFTVLYEEGETGLPQPLISEQRGDQELRHPLPRSTYAEFATKRPNRVKDGYSPDSRINEHIGPSELEGNRLWFGKTFYDGEGWTGVGGFGYFDAETSTYRLFAPNEIADWSVSALDVAEDAIWLALVQRGEWGDTGGGLLRFDRRSETVQELDLPDIVNLCLRVGERLLFATDFGIAVAENGRVRRYFVDRATDGSLHVAEATRVN